MSVGGSHEADMNMQPARSCRIILLVAVDRLTKFQVIGGVP